MNRTNRNSSATGFVIVACLLAVVHLLQSGAPAQTAEQSNVTPSPAAQSVLENMEITKDGGVNFYTTQDGKRRRSLAISPQGSLIAGGVSRIGTPHTNEPQLIDPVEYDKAGAGGGRNWVHDFYFGRFGHGEGQPRLYSRGLFLWGRGDSPDIQLGRTGPDNTECTHEPRHDPPGSHQNPACQPTTYGPQSDTSPGTSLGKIVFVNWGEGQFQGDLASITARNDTVATKTKNPGSLEFHVAGPTMFPPTTNPAYDEKKKARAWRDGPTRMVIKSNGYVGIGDDPSPSERLHVHGNMVADGNITAKGDVVATGAKKFAIDHPTQTGKKLVHAAIEGPESAVYYRGETQLVNGRAEVYLPAYFEALARREGRTVMLTNTDGFDRLAIVRQDGLQVVNGKFTVISDNAASSQAFNWEVKAVRADLVPLLVEK